MWPAQRGADNHNVSATTTIAARRPGGVAERAVASALIVAALGPLAVANAIAAFEADGSPADAFPGGSVLLRSDAPRAMFSLDAMAPGETASSIITVRYVGSEPATVRLYGRSRGTGLDGFLHVSVTRGAGTGRSFKADSTDYVGAGRGVVYAGTLAEFPEDFRHGIVVAGPGSWRGPEARSYRFEIALAGRTRAQGLAAVRNFVWEARPT